MSQQRGQNLNTYRQIRGDIYINFPESRTKTTKMGTGREKKIDPGIPTYK